MSYPDHQNDSRRSARGALLAALFSVVVTACAPNAWRPDPRYAAFLDQVQNKCGNERIGSREIGRRNSTSDLTQDAYFLDLTSRFYHGEIPRDDYANSLAGSYGGAADSVGIRCLLGLIPVPEAVPPSRMPRYQ